MKNKLTQKQFIFFAINYIVGFGFISTIAGVISKGEWGMLIFLITAFISMAVALAFSRASQNYPHTVGGSYAYAKIGFKKHFAFFQGWNQFAQIPFFAATSPLFFAQILGDIDPNNRTIYQISSIAIFVILTMLASFGLKISKKIIFFSAIIKWLALLVGLLLVAFYSFRDLNYTQNFLNRSDKITISVITGTVVSFIYAFGGMEGLAAISNDVEVKNFRKILMSIFLVILTGYFIFYLVFLGVNNSEIIAKTKVNNVSLETIYIYSMGFTGIVLYGIGIFFNRGTSLVSSSVYYARTIVPLAEDGYMPKILAKKNKHGEYGNAIYFLLVISIVSMIVFSIIPIVAGVENVFNNILQTGTTAFLIQYFSTILTVLIIGYRDKSLKVPFWEQIIYYVGLVVIALVLLFTLIPPIVGDSWKVENSIMLPSYIVVMLLGYLIWFANHLLVKKRTNKKQIKHS